MHTHACYEACEACALWTFGLIESARVQDRCLREPGQAVSSKQIAFFVRKAETKMSWPSFAARKVKRILLSKPGKHLSSQNQSFSVTFHAFRI